MKKLSKTQYLYGDVVNPTVWRNLSYIEALKLKIILSQDTIALLNTSPYMQRDATRINECCKAIKFNQELIEETK